MNATHRCCCGVDCDDCCEIWCECPELIEVTTCEQIFEETIISCDNEGPECGIADGTVIGSLVCRIKLTGVVFQKHTCDQGVGPDHCEYRIATGEDQTGLLEYSIDGNYRKCEDSRLDDETGDCLCAWYDNVCLGTATVPLNHPDWIDQICGRLSFGPCCDSYCGAMSEPGNCGECTCEPSLRIYVQGSKPNGKTIVDCCPGGPGTFQEDLVFTTEFKAKWQCQHVTRTVGTCPIDLNDLDVECSFLGPGCDCYTTTGGSPFGGVTTCPCNPVGQDNDYYSCVVQPFSCGSLIGINYCSEFESRWAQLVPTPGPDCYRCATIIPVP